jgi:Sec-independent protein translocase protein TatA
VSLPDIFLIALLGLIVFGPKKLASIAPEPGKMLARWKKDDQPLSIAIGSGGFSERE